jgi:hypothetical protein
MIFRPSGYGRKQPCLPLFLGKENVSWKPLASGVFTCGIAVFSLGTYRCNIERWCDSGVDDHGLGYGGVLWPSYQ